MTVMLKEPGVFKNLLITVILVITVILTTSVLQPIKSIISSGTIGNVFITQLALLFASFMVIPLSYSFFYKQWFPNLFFNRNIYFLETLRAAAIIVLCLFILLELIKKFTGTQNSEWLSNVIAPLGSLDMIIMMSTSIILAPIAEELIFRWLLFDAVYFPICKIMNERVGATLAIITTSVLFTLMHEAQYHYIELSYIFSISLVFGWARWKTKGLIAPIMIHMFAGFIGINYLYFFA